MFIRVFFATAGDADRHLALSTSEATHTTDQSGTEKGERAACVVQAINDIFFSPMNKEALHNGKDLL